VTLRYKTKRAGEKAENYRRAAVVAIVGGGVVTKTVVVIKR